jgi:uncharacterized protein YbbC (DUF1343 family)
MLNVTDPHAFPSVRTAIEILCAARAQGKYAVAGAAGMDRDWGTDAVRLALSAGAGPDAIVAAWEPQLRAFRALRERYLLY